MEHFFTTCKKLLAVGCLVMVQQMALAQTDQDAIMMTKNNFCVGGMYGHNSWKNYWEGTYKRNNANLGTVSSQSIALMGNYGISDKLNVIVGAPYVTTKASEGTLHGMKGVQDISLWVKWLALEKDLGAGTFSLYVVGGASTPLTNYVADFLPLSIGLRSKTLSGRLMVDYQLKRFFATASGTYSYRSNIKIDRTAYYTTDLHLTNEVEMPDVASFQFRTGYRSTYLIAEAIVSNMTTLGGFDIRKNDMPFPSNKMNATTAGINIKYSVKQLPGLSLIGGGNYTLAGRNVGQTTSINGGIFYILDFSKKTTSSNTSTQSK